MNILSMLGLMKVEDHEDLIEQQDQANYQAWQRVCEQRDKFKQQVVDTCTRAEKAEAERDDARRGFLNAQAKFVAAAKDLADQADELATFRAKRDRDNAQRRERHARKANDAAPKAKKGAAK